MSLTARYTATLDEIRAAGLFKSERIITGPQSAEIELADGRTVLNFCANNYLGLADHPDIIAAAKENGAANDPLIRQRLAKAEIGLNLMRYGAMRMLSNTDHSKVDGAALTYKIQWATWRRSLGELAMDVLGQAGEVTYNTAYEWDMLPNLFLYSRADTIYGGTNQIQRNLIAERGLSMPREPRGDVR